MSSSTDKDVGSTDTSKEEPPQEKKVAVAVAGSTVRGTDHGNVRNVGRGSASSTGTCTSILDRDGEDTEGDELAALSAAKAAMYAQQALSHSHDGVGADGSDSSDSSDDDGEQGFGASAGSQAEAEAEAEAGRERDDPMAAYCSLGACSGSDDEDFEDFQAYVPADAGGISIGIGAGADVCLGVGVGGLWEEEGGAGAGRGPVGLSLPSEEEAAPYTLAKKKATAAPTAPDGDIAAAKAAAAKAAHEVSYGIPALPPCPPADRLAPLSASKIESIRNAMAGLRIAPRGSTTGTEALVQRLLGRRLGDEKAAAAAVAAAAAAAAAGQK